MLRPTRTASMLFLRPFLLGFSSLALVKASCPDPPDSDCSAFADLPTITNRDDLLVALYNSTDVDFLDGPTGTLGDGEDLVGIHCWNVSRVTHMSQMFQNQASFNLDITCWDVSAVTAMEAMFKDATAFNQNIGGWNVAAVTNMQRMFYGAEAFNQNIGGWNVGKVTNMFLMFGRAKAFNQNIGGWNVAAVTDMYWMFSQASSFNQDISRWNISKVTSMYAMFSGAEAFNQDLCPWGKITTITDTENVLYMFRFSGCDNRGTPWLEDPGGDQNGPFCSNNCDPPPVPSDPICFPADSMVQLESGESIRIDRVQVGDKVKVEAETNKFEPIYGFAHRDVSTTSTNYLKISWSKNSFLEISIEHMLLASSSTHPEFRMVPASKVQVGGKIKVDGSATQVISIQKTRSTGLFAPLTFSGKIVVNGVQASQYISVQNEENLVIGAYHLHFLNYQWLTHTFLTPVRVVGSLMSNTSWMQAFLLNLIAFTKSILSLPVPILLPIAAIGLLVVSVMSMLEAFVLAPVNQKLAILLAILIIGIARRYLNASVRIVSTKKKI